MNLEQNVQKMILGHGVQIPSARYLILKFVLVIGIQDIMEKNMEPSKEFEKIKDEYDKLLEEMAEVSGKTVEELDEEISDAIDNCANLEDILIKSSEII